MHAILKYGGQITLLAAILLLVAGCVASAEPRPVSASVVEAMSAPADAGYARAVAPIEFQFPRDHGPHPEYRTEWWYYTGNLTGPEAAQYGYQLTFFRTALAPEAAERTSNLAANQVYMAHFALSDGVRSEHVSFDRYSRGAGTLAGAVGEPRHGVWLEDWHAKEVEPGVIHLFASAQDANGPVAIDLVLRETRAPIAHGAQGLHQKGPEAGNASYYYSLVNLDTTGTITSAGQGIPVTGLSWMDHEFGTSALSEGAVGWDWFSMQLDNGAVAMLYTIRTTDGVAPPDLEATLVWPDGRQQTLHRDDFAIEPAAQWTSPRTGITYPVAWTVTLPALDIHLEIEALLPDQEMDVSFLYWEGAVNITGDWQGEPVAGRGYVELTGYGEEGSGEYQR
jgi:predicted secreted hydrolase